MSLQMAIKANAIIAANGGGILDAYQAILDAYNFSGLNHCAVDLNLNGYERRISYGCDTEEIMTAYKKWLFEGGQTQ